MTPERRFVEYEEVRRGIHLLLELIATAEDGWLPDAIVAVSRGGLVPATHFCYYFQQPIYFIYDTTLAFQMDGQQRVLVVDEINDTGKTFQRIREEIFDQPPNDQLDVRFAAIYTRYTSKFQADYFLDYHPYYVEDDAYQVFPWEEER